MDFSPEANLTTLARRLSLDLTGLPPSLEELQTFTQAPYEKMVDHFLAKPAFGEHWARAWLDLVRAHMDNAVPAVRLQ